MGWWVVLTASSPRRVVAAVMTEGHFLALGADVPSLNSMGVRCLIGLCRQMIAAV